MRYTSKNKIFDNYLCHLMTEDSDWVKIAHVASLPFSCFFRLQLHHAKSFITSSNFWSDIP